MTIWQWIQHLQISSVYMPVKWKHFDKHTKKNNLETKKSCIKRHKNAIRKKWLLCPCGTGWKENSTNGNWRQWFCWIETNIGIDPGLQCHHWVHHWIWNLHCSGRSSLRQDQSPPPLPYFTPQFKKSNLTMAKSIKMRVYGRISVVYLNLFSFRRNIKRNT